jgi:transposase
MVQRVLRQGWRLSAAAAAAGVSRQTASKWLRRFEAEGVAGLADRSSRPRRSPRALAEGEIERLDRWRRQRWPLWRIARELRRALSTVSRCAKRLGLSRLASLEPRLAVVRYERAAAGELLHLDTKKLGRIDGVGHRITGDRALNRNRGIGWDMVHLAIDDHSRVCMPSSRPTSAGTAVRSSCARPSRITPAWASRSTAS